MVARILLVRVRRPGRGKSDAGVLGQFDGAFGGTVEDVEVDEVAALGMRPVGNLRVAEPVVGDVENQLELGREQLTVLAMGRARRRRRRRTGRRSWLILSGPIVETPRCLVNQATLAADEPKNATPAPAEGDLEVDPSTYTRLG